MTALIIATRHEAAGLLKHLSAVKDQGIYHFRGRIAQGNVALYLCRAGVASKEQLRRFLRLHKFERVLLAGTAASLNAALAHVQCVQVAQATAPGEKILTVAAAGLRSVSVRQLVVQDSAKADLRAMTGADLLDMETYSVAQIMAEPEFSAVPFTALRIIDDLPGEESYLAKERQLRELTLRTPRAYLAVHEILRFGAWDYLRILLRRRRVAAAVARAVETNLSIARSPSP